MKEEMKGMWKTMWEQEEREEEGREEEEREGSEKETEEYLLEFKDLTEESGSRSINGETEQITFPSFEEASFEEFSGVIKYVPNQKAAGVDGIYNFFIKKLTSIHSELYRIIREICVFNISSKLFTLNCLFKKEQKFLK